jgi:hypothetical protein
VCVLGVPAAIYHDPEADHLLLRKLIGVVLVVALVALTLTLTLTMSMTLGLDETLYNPIVGSDA